MTPKKPSQVEQITAEQNNDKRRLMYFTLGAALFFIGGGALQLSHQYLSESWQQEIIALIALAVMACGAMIAAYYYVVLAVVRIKRIMMSNP